MRLDNSLLSITAAEPVKADFFAVPKATTSTSSNCSESERSTTLTVGLIVTSWLSKPMNETTKVFAGLN